MQKILTIDFKNSFFNKFEEGTNIPEIDTLLNEDGWEVSRIEILTPIEHPLAPKVMIHLSKV